MVTKTGTIFEADLQQTEPEVLQYDPGSAALDRALATALSGHMQLTRDSVGIYYRTMELTERMCDILASDMHIDWYDYDWTLEEKRRAVTKSVAIHRKMGTVQSVKDAVSIVATGGCTVEEWFEYGGEPYRFRVTLEENEGTESNNLSRVLAAINLYKPVRARLDTVLMQTELASDSVACYGARLSGYHTTPMVAVMTEPSNSSVLGAFILDVGILM